MNIITKESLEFLEEAKNQFSENPDYPTYRDDKGEFIALRTGFHDDSIMIYELGSIVGNFVEQLPRQHKVLIDYDDLQIYKGLIKKAGELIPIGTEDYCNGVKAVTEVLINELDKVKHKY